MNVYIQNLGCDKNRVDGEKLAGRLNGAGWTISETPDSADIVIVNTCGFIGPAKQESLDAIFGFAKNKKVVVSGCLAKRYETEIRANINEADLVVGLSDTEDSFNKIIKRFGSSKHSQCEPKRPLSGPAHVAPLKIAEGCSNHCSYCAIPLIRGRHRSRSETEILAEARQLRSQGVKELILVAQDITAYQDRKGLPRLLRKLSRNQDPFEWIRLMYCHPCGVSDDLLEIIASEKAIAKYIDLPLQHISSRLLGRMNRHYDRKYVETLIRKIRDRIPGAALRTTFIVGFPGETKEEFQELQAFVQEAQFDRMGAFPYSPEEGTKAFRFKGGVPEKTKKERMEELMVLQSNIIFRKNSALVGKTLKVLVDEKLEGVFIGRTERDAPEVDCNVILAKGKWAIGQFRQVKIKRAIGLDLYG
jgi:ribosomal protein S12 methylthiotransferase